MRKRYILFSLILLGTFSVGLSACNIITSTTSTSLSESQTYTITWKNYDGTILEVDENVPHGTIPTYDGGTPVRFDDSQFIYVFGGWYPSVTIVESNQTYSAAFQETTQVYTITWKNHDGTVLEVDNEVPYGTLPTYNEDIPSKDSEGGFIYLFSGWSPSIAPVTGHATYTAVFDEIPLKAGDKYYLGSYPQTEVTDNTLITILNDSAGALPTASNSQSWTPYNYYISGSNTTKFMWYQDISVDQDSYRGIYFTSYRPYCTICSSSTNNSYQDDNGYLINNRYWFKYEPISWDILSVDEETGPLVLSSNIIDSQEYFHLGSGTRTIEGQTVYLNNYKESNIRTWLNNSFLNTAFSSSEQSLIKTTNVDNGAYSSGYVPNQYATTNTDDKLFLLSYREAVNSDYGFSTSESIHASRVRSATDYAKAMGIYVSSGNSYWWLRSPFYDLAQNASSVRYDGYVGINYVHYVYFGVLPAFRINL